MNGQDQLLMAVAINLATLQDIHEACEILCWEPEALILSGVRQRLASLVQAQAAPGSEAFILAKRQTL